jgi:hypothetical protein
MADPLASEQELLRVLHAQKADVHDQATRFSQYVERQKLQRPRLPGRAEHHVHATLLGWCLQNVGSCKSEEATRQIVWRLIHTLCTTTQVGSSQSQVVLLLEHLHQPNSRLEHCTCPPGWTS